MYWKYYTGSREPSAVSKSVHTAVNEHPLVPGPISSSDSGRTKTGQDVYEHHYCPERLGGSPFYSVGRCISQAFKKNKHRIATVVAFFYPSDHEKATQQREKS